MRLAHTSSWSRVRSTKIFGRQAFAHEERNPDYPVYPVDADQVEDWSACPASCCCLPPPYVGFQSYAASRPAAESGMISFLMV